jgi:hypothetical protein
VIATETCIPETLSSEDAQKKYRSQTRQWSWLRTPAAMK